MAVLGSPEGARRHTPTRDLAAYLRGEYRAGVPWRLTVRHPSGTGYELSDKVVSRLEIANALRLLSYRQRRLIELHYGDDLSRDRVCRLLGISEATFHRDQAEALRTIVGAVYEWGQDETEGAA
jgi:DNA-directed RNA polymerase specialized sigma24 family protein